MYDVGDTRRCPRKDLSTQSHEIRLEHLSTSASTCRELGRMSKTVRNMIWHCRVGVRYLLRFHALGDYSISRLKFSYMQSDSLHQGHLQYVTFNA